ncbi:transposase [Mesorhizobium sp. VK25A]|uniref:Transposase n=2 Tax=Mesorhizobium TaxID=68287 RepID=A0ABU4YVN4_9HYPH|nr:MULTISPECIES: transposase [unclassified Mesorhizobium]MDX8463578.1 transposase [Mesorhizobium sp. VK2D]MDX8476815.1 transposase [Mesorhizobium sp. VK23A]MDX8489924.1 transposase [Mesorhizobium sp. VK2B]MDX8548718.1 transposase [Mesorhizobium sp. VK25A]
MIPDPDGFKSGRHFAPWLRLTPKPHSSDGKEQLGGISKWATRRSARCSFVARRRRNRARQQDGEDHLGAARQGRDISKYWRGEQRSTRLSRYDDQDGLADATPDRGEVQN